MKLSRLLILSVVFVLCAVSLTQAQSSMGFENCTGHLVAPSLPWYRPAGSSAVCVAGGRAHSGVYAAMAVPATAYGPVCQDISLNSGDTVNIDLWCRTSGDQQRSVTVALRAAGGDGGNIDTANTGDCAAETRDGYNDYSVWLNFPGDFDSGTYALCFGNGPGNNDVQVLVDDIEVAINGFPMPTHTPTPTPETTPTVTPTPDPPTPTPTPIPISDRDIPPIGSGEAQLSDGALDVMGVTLGAIGVTGIGLTASVFLSKIFKRVFSR